MHRSAAACVSVLRTSVAIIDLRIIKSHCKILKYIYTRFVNEIFKSMWKCFHDRMISPSMLNVWIHSVGVSICMTSHVSATPIDVDSKFLLYPAPLSLFHVCPKCNHSICSWWKKKKKKQCKWQTQDALYAHRGTSGMAHQANVPLCPHRKQGWKKPRFLELFFRFLGFLGFLGFLVFLGFNAHNAEHGYIIWPTTSIIHENICLLIHYLYSVLNCAIWKW